MHGRAGLLQLRLRVHVIKKITQIATCLYLCGKEGFMWKPGFYFPQAAGHKRFPHLCRGQECEADRWQAERAIVTGTRERSEIKPPDTSKALEDGVFIKHNPEYCSEQEANSGLWHESPTPYTNRVHPLGGNCNVAHIARIAIESRERESLW